MERDARAVVAIPSELCTGPHEHGEGVHRLQDVREDLSSEIITVVPGGRHESPATGKKRGTCKDFILDLNACIVYGCCVQVCPEDAILMLKVQEEPGYQREDRPHHGQAVRERETGCDHMGDRRQAHRDAGTSPTPAQGDTRSGR